MKSSLLLVLLYIAVPVFSVQAEEVIGIRYAYKVGQLALIGTHSETGTLESSFDDDAPDSDGFYVMQGWSKHGTFGWFAVNAWTGDVWNLGGSNCKQLSNPALRTEQKKIKRRFSDEKEYERLSRMKPRRMYDLETCGSPP